MPSKCEFRVIGYDTRVGKVFPFSARGYFKAVRAAKEAPGRHGSYIELTCDSSSIEQTYIPSRFIKLASCKNGVCHPNEIEPAMATRDEPLAGTRKRRRTF